ncbi:hypothetical protein HRI_003825700 [Hibiscus trionum]|uniref:Transposase n=1 Tax=Hibiscus trionum TaxID=183268 RepID=A0A9W7IRY7_HIBTR|nr:hypothetical protein HRI_003825700 [Hibiscus trionum]
MSKSTLHRRIKEGFIKPHTNAIKPYLTDANKKARLHFCLSMLEPAIRAKWPSSSDKRIFIQQDNAKPHIDIDDEQFLQAASVGDFNFQLFFQPPNSPDLNVLDLGYFRAIQSLQHQESPTNIDELVNGANNYRLPHMGKERLERNGELPIQLHCDRSIVQETLL